VAISSAQSAWVRARSAARSAARRRAKFPSARAGGRGRGGARYAAERGVPRVSAWAKARWHAGPQPGVVAMCSLARIGVGEGAVACSSIDFGRPGALLTSGQPSDIWLGLWGSASWGAAQSASMFIWFKRRVARGGHGGIGHDCSKTGQSEIAKLPLVIICCPRNTRAPHFTPQHWLLCHMGLY